jgi:hypothetical protein
MPEHDRKRMTAMYNLFRLSALEDQRTYYKRTVARHRKAASQVNWYRALFAFLTGLSSALAGLLVANAIASGTLEACKTSQLSVLTQQTEALQAEATIEPTIAPTATPTPTPRGAVSTEAAATTVERDCSTPNTWVPFLLVVAVVAPALGGAFTTLADLYQWDRLITIYDTAVENLEVADAQSPLDAMPDLDYRASLRAYAEGTLMVMRDETAQWGQLIKTPASLEKFIAEEKEKAERSNPHLGEDDSAEHG